MHRLWRITHIAKVFIVLSKKSQSRKEKDIHSIDMANNGYDTCNFNIHLNAIKITDVDIRSVTQSDDRFIAGVKVNSVEIKSEVL